MTDALIRLAALALLVTFAWAAVAKALLPARWRAAVAGYGLPRPVAMAAVVAVPVAELAVAMLLVTGQTRPGAALALSLVTAFSVAIVRATGPATRRLPCGCFGGRREMDATVMMGRNGVLAVLGGLTLVAGHDVDAGGVGTADLVPILLTVVAIGIVAWTLAETSHHLRRGRRA